jgi:hypothetical protein
VIEVNELLSKINAKAKMVLKIYKHLEELIQCGKLQFMSNKVEIKKESEEIKSKADHIIKVFFNRLE